MNVLQISFKEGHLLFDNRMAPKASKVIGFGRFVDKYKPKDVQITKEAKAILLKGVYRSGLQGCEIFDHQCIAWGSPAYGIWVKPNEISVHGTKAKELIKQFTVITDKDLYVVPEKPKRKKK